MDDHHPDRAVPCGERCERAEPETGVAESDLLQHDDLPADVDPGVVGLLTPADEHELAANPSGRRRRREVRRNRVERPTVGDQLKLDPAVAVAERGELAIADLESQAAKPLAGTVGRDRVAGPSHEAVAGRHELLHVGDGTPSADPASQIVFDRGRHRGDRTPVQPRSQ